MKIFNQLFLFMLLGVFSSAYAAHHEAGEHDSEAEKTVSQEQEVRSSCVKDVGEAESKFPDEKSCLEAHGLKAKQ
jgi:hypothetical protein